MQTRTDYLRAWKKANRIRRALADLTGNRNGPGKAWADECRVMLSRAERAHRRALRRQEEARAMVSAWRRKNHTLAAFWQCPPHDPVEQERFDRRGYPPAI